MKLWGQIRKKKLRLQSSYRKDHLKSCRNIMASLFFPNSCMKPSNSDILPSFGGNIDSMLDASGSPDN